MTKRKRVLKTKVEKLIHFIGRTYEQVIAAYEKLKNRYRIKVSLSRLRPQGCLFTGFFTVA